MEDNIAKARLYKRWGQITLVLGLLGVIDLTTKSLVPVDLDLGGISFLILIIGTAVGGAAFGALLSVIGATVLDLSLGWLVISYFLYQKSKALSNPTAQATKGVKRAKVLLYILGVVVALILLATLAASISQ